jgi:hypothetical protein
MLPTGHEGGPAATNEQASKMAAAAFKAIIGMMLLMDGAGARIVAPQLSRPFHTFGICLHLPNGAIGLKKGKLSLSLRITYADGVGYLCDDFEWPAKLVLFLLI